MICFRPVIKSYQNIVYDFQKLNSVLAIKFLFLQKKNTNQILKSIMKTFGNKCPFYSTGKMCCAIFQCSDFLYPRSNRI